MHAHSHTLKIFIFFFCFFSSNLLQAQNKANPGEKKDSTILNDNPVAKDTTTHNHYGDLLEDNPYYERKYPWWKPALEVVGVNAFIFGVDRYIFKYEFATQVSVKTWKYNLKQGWEWDTDRFGVNFIGHPYSGTLYYNAARSNGYSYFESIPFAIGGSLLWEYFGENTRPSYNDIINTPVHGSFLGEILYRVSSNILDDHKRGPERVIREVAAGIINPMRGLNRLLQGKTKRVVRDTIYQKDLLNLTMFAGLRKVNEGKKFGTGPSNEIFNLHLDYGNPFELRDRKPFDYFRLRMEFNFGVNRKILDNVVGYAILKGKNVTHKKVDMLVGFFQYYNYWDNKTFELGTLAFGWGVISKIPVKNKSFFYNNFHLGLVPIAGNSTRRGPIVTTETRDYDYGAGLEAQFESVLDFHDWATLTLLGYYYYLQTYFGVKREHSYIGLFKPRISIKLYKNLRAGFEELIYINDRYQPNMPDMHLSQTEQKFFLLYYFDNTHNQKKFTK